MSESYLSLMFPAACAGLGLILVGGANLLLPRRGAAVRALATLLALTVSVGAAAALDQPGATIGTINILAVGLVPCLLLGSNYLNSALTAFVSALHRPTVRFGLLSVAGIGTAVGSIVICEQAERATIDTASAGIERIYERLPAVDSPNTPAATDHGTPVVLKKPGTVRGGEGLTAAAAEENVLRNTNLGDQVIRRGPACDRSNCHGWVFAGGKFLLSPDDVELILKENGYEEVQDPHAGEVVIYRKDGAITHSALIRYVTEGQPVLVEGKWGNLGVFLHPADKSPYGSDYAFYRSPRPGHLLVGLGGAPTTGESPPAATETE